MTDALQTLLELLELEAIEVNIFRGQSPEEPSQRVYGGQVAAQSLMAAGRTVDEGQVHSLHSYFLRPGDPGVPILYQVDRIRDGRSFTTRRVVAIQHGRAIFNLAASFHVDEDSFEHQRPMPEVTPPAELATMEERLAPYAEELGEWATRPRPIDTRFVKAPPAPGERRVREPAQQIWLRTDGPLPDDPLLHACVLAYASDMFLVDTILLPHGVLFDDPGLMTASLDHCMWFHRPFRADSWLLYDLHSIVAHGARGLAQGYIYTQDGLLAVTVTQEGLVRSSPAQRSAIGT